MKIRLGFVSNSSSSSYVCDVCSREASGWDLGLSEADMRQCVNGHVFCESHYSDWEPTWQEKKEAVLGCWSIKKEENKPLRLVVEAVSTKEKFDEADEKYDLEWMYEDMAMGYDVPPSACPVCSFVVLHKPTAVAYLLKVARRDEADLLKELKERFGEYKELKAWLKE